MWRLFTATLGVITLTLLLLVHACSLTSEDALKSEDALRGQFEEHKNLIFEIQDMHRHDPKVIRIAPTFTRLDSDWGWPRKNIGFSEGRWNKYRALFQEAGIKDGIEQRNHYTFYYVSSNGLALGGSETSRGFAYTEQPDNLVKSFDECGYGVCLIPLGKNWYLFQWES